MNELAIQTASEKPPVVKASEGNASVNEDGLYEQAREQIVLAEGEKGLWNKFVSLFTAAAREEEKREHLATIPQINLDVVLPEQPQPVVEFVEQPKKFRRIKKLLNRDEEGNITSVEEIEIEDNKE
jgi:hypothetical protein